MERTTEEQKQDNDGDLKTYKLGTGDFTMIRSMPAPPQGVKDVFTSILLLLGYTEKEAKDWRIVKKLFAKSGKESLVSRCNECNAENVPVKSAIVAKNILDEYSVEEIENKCKSVASFYAWSKLMVDEVLNAQNMG